MELFGPPNIEKLEAKRDFKGLIKALGYEKNDQIPAVAIEALARIGTPVVEPLIAALKDKHERVRYFTVEALGEIGDVRAVEPLIAALKDNNEHVRRAAVKILSKFMGSLVDALKDSDDDVRSPAMVALGKIGTPAVESLIAALNNSIEYVRWSAAEVLGGIGDTRAVDPLVTALKDSDELVRLQVAEALGKIGDVRAIEPLVAALKDQVDLVRDFAVDALIEIGAPAVGSLIVVLKDNDEIVCKSAAQVLRMIGGEKAEQALKKYEHREQEELKRGVSEELSTDVRQAMKKTLLEQLLDGKLVGTINQVRNAYANVSCNFEFAVSVNTWELQKHMDEANEKGFIAWGNQDSKSAIIYGAGFVTQDNFSDRMAWLNRIRVKNDVPLVHLMTKAGEKNLVIE